MAASSGVGGPRHGVPFAVKDSIDTAGVLAQLLRCIAGSEQCAQGGTEDVQGTLAAAACGQMRKDWSSCVRDNGGSADAGITD